MKKNTLYLAAIVICLFIGAVLAYGQATTQVVDPTTMSEDDVKKLSASDLEKLLISLRAQNTQEDLLLKQTKAFNLAMCNKLEAVKAQCIGMNYISTDATDAFSCADGAKASATTITVQAHNLGNYRFRIRLNKKFFYSTDFGEGETTITFTKTSASPDLIPLFKEISDITFVSVNPNSTLDLNGVHGVKVIDNRDSLIANMQFNILVNGTPIITPKDASKPWLNLTAPADALSEIQVNPTDVSKVGLSQSCIVSLDEINAMKKSAESAK